MDSKPVGDCGAVSRLGKYVGKYAWIAFARTGNPNTDALPQWPAYDLNRRATMIFNVNSQVQNDPYGEIRRILMKFSK